MAASNASADEGTDLEDLSNEEFLERVAGLDPDQYPIAEHAERALKEPEGEPRDEDDEDGDQA